MGVADYARLYDMLDEAMAGKRPIYMNDGERFFNSGRVLTTAPYSAYVKISDGCNNRCTYCAIPLIRGNYASRPFDDIVAECRRLASEGVTEITLIAQDTSRYGCDFGDRHFMLPELLRAVSEIEGVHWVRVLYCYPDSTEDRLLDEIANNPKVAPYLDLPLQHINDPILKAMNRRGSADWIRSRIAECKKRGLTLRTTMIVGFPGETEEQFEELLQFVKDARFDRLGAFTYSPEEGTKAAVMPDQIDEEIKTARRDRIMELQQEISLDKGENRVGSVMDVVIEGKVADEDAYIARSYADAPGVDGYVFIENVTADLMSGTFVKVYIKAAMEYDLIGELYDDEDESAE